MKVAFEMPSFAASKVLTSIRAFATRDFFPEFSARVRRWAYHPLGVLLLATLVSLLCGLFLHPRMFALAAGLLLVMGVGVCWPALTIRGAAGRWSFEQERCVEGDEVSARVTVTNHLPWPAAGLVLRDSGTEAAVRLGTVPARQEMVAKWDFKAESRGEYPVGVPELLTGFPFGLWQARKRAAIDKRLIVWPKTFPVGPPPCLDGDSMIEGSVARRKVGSTGEVLGVRPYRRGDSPRRIHWPQSARHDRLIVCEFEATSRPVVQLVLDGDASIHSVGPEGSLEWAIRTAASMARGWLEIGVQVGLVAPGVMLASASGSGQIRRIMDSLARLPSDSSQSLRDLLGSPVCRQFESGVQVIITTDRRRWGRSTARQRWVVLSAMAFGASPVPSARCDELPPRLAPWLFLDAPQRVPQLLRYGWSEARHGS